MTDNFEIIQYSRALKETVLELQTNLWSPNRALNAAYLEWKYESNPYVKEPLIYLAMNQGRAVGMRGVFTTKWQIGSRDHTFLALYADDLVVDPEHRNQGLITRIMKFAFNDLCERGFDYVLNLSAGPITTMSSLAMGWRSVGSLQPLSRGRPSLLPRLRERLNSTPFLWRFARFLRSKKDHDPFLSLDQSRLRLSDQLSVERLPEPEAMADLIDRLDYDGRLRHVRDVEYLSWRFQNPLHAYRFIFVWKGTRLRGYLMLQSKRSDLSDRESVNLVDWEGETLEIKAQLLQTAICQGRFQKLFTWGAMLCPEEMLLLKATGFTQVPQTREQKWRNCLLLRPIQAHMLSRDWVIAGRNLMKLENWDIRLIYSMRG
jgi:GNAT superfamily N-acetyltransferase